MTSEQFWALSLKELWLERRYARQKHRDERDRDVILAWQIMRVKVQTQNDKRLPDVKTLILPPDRDEAQRQTPAEQMAIMRAIREMHSGSPHHRITRTRTRD